MTGKLLDSILIGLLASPLAANAQNVLGDWQGSVVYGFGPDAGSTQTLSLDVTSETKFLGGELLSGRFDMGNAGYDPFSGYLSSTGLFVDGSLMLGQLSSGGNSVKGTGLDDHGFFNFTVNKISAPELDPTGVAGALVLLIGGIAVLSAGRSRSRPQTA